MLRSMTGFGRCLVENSHMTQQWEIRSVNGRHLDIRWHLSSSLRSVQARLEKILRQHAFRGRVDISLMLHYGADAARQAQFDVSQASAMLDALYSLAKERGEAFVPDYNALLSIPPLWGDMGHEAEEELASRLEEGLLVAIDDWNESRAAEGQSLAIDLQSRILRAEQWAQIIEERVPQIKEERINTVRERLHDLLQQQGLELDEGRFLQEVVILSDKVDVSEEITRLRTHLERLNELLLQGKDVGRRLDFTLQECFREINTCGNKIPDVQLSRIVVDFKNELEKCREQAQNLE